MDVGNILSPTYSFSIVGLAASPSLPGRLSGHVASLCVRVTSLAERG